MTVVDVEVVRPFVNLPALSVLEPILQRVHDSSPYWDRRGNLARHLIPIRYRAAGQLERIEVLHQRRADLARRSTDGSGPMQASGGRNRSGRRDVDLETARQPRDGYLLP